MDIESIELRDFIVGKSSIAFLNGDCAEWDVVITSNKFAILTRSITESDIEWWEEDGWDMSVRYNEDDLFYTILDFQNLVRGPCNLIGGGYGINKYNRDNRCFELLDELTHGALEVSQRNRIKTTLKDIRV